MCLKLWFLFYFTLNTFKSEIVSGQILQCVDFRNESVLTGASCHTMKKSKGVFITLKVLMKNPIIQMCIFFCTGFKFKTLLSFVWILFKLKLLYSISAYSLYIIKILNWAENADIFHTVPKWGTKILFINFKACDLM